MVQFSSLEEVYGKDFTIKYEEKLVSQEDFTKVQYDKNPLPLFLQNKGYNQNQCYQLKSPQSSLQIYNQQQQQNQQTQSQPQNTKYQQLQQNSEQKRNEIISNMNSVFLRSLHEDSIFSVKIFSSDFPIFSRHNVSIRLLHDFIFPSNYG